MVDRRPEDEIMCETSEPAERLIPRDQLLTAELEIGPRLLEVFGYQTVSNIVYRLKSNRTEINAIIDGGALPSVELLMGIRQLTGVSIDWLLTGAGQKFAPLEAPPDMPINSQIVPFREYLSHPASN